MELQVAASLQNMVQGSPQTRELVTAQRQYLHKMTLHTIRTHKHIIKYEATKKLPYHTCTIYELLFNAFFTVTVELYMC